MAASDLRSPTGIMAHAIRVSRHRIQRGARDVLVNVANWAEKNFNESYNDPVLYPFGTLGLRVVIGCIVGPLSLIWTYEWWGENAILLALAAPFVAALLPVIAYLLGAALTLVFLAFVVAMFIRLVMAFL
jgi:hypothetical protein